MAIKAAELQVVVGADTNPAVQGIRGAMGMIGSAASTALGVFTSNLMTQAISSLGSLASAGIQAVGEFERMSATLGTLVKRDLVNTGQSLDLVGQKTQELLNWVQQLAKESPFDATGVTMALRTAMAYGFTADQAQRLVKASIDYAAGSGQSVDLMNQIALALGQIQAKGKLAGQEMIQLTNAGINVSDALAKYLGITVEEVMQRLEDGTIDANTAIEAVVGTLEKDFGGAAKEQSQTVSGLVSTFGELKKMGLRELFAGLVEAVRPLAIAFTEWLSGEGMARLHEMGQSIGNLATRVVQFIRSGAQLMPLFSGIGGIMMQSLLPALTALATQVGPVIGNVMGNLVPIFSSLAMQLVSMLAPAIMTIITQALPPLLSLFQALLPVVMAIASAVMPILNVVIGVLVNLIVQLVGVLTPLIQASLPLLAELFAAVGSVAAQLAETILPLLADILTALVQAVAPLVGALLPLLAEILKLIAKVVETYVLPIIEKFSDWLRENMQPAIEAIVEVIQKVVDWIKKLADGLSNIELPDWLTPGSPTPFEMGLRGIASALDEVARKKLPVFESALQVSPVAATAIGAGAGAGVTLRNYGTIVVGSGSTLEAELLAALR